MHMSHDMDEPSGLPWLNSPVMLHSSRADTCKLTPEQCAYRSGHWRYWYQADHVYALNTVYFMCATVGVFAIAHFAARYAPARVRGSSLWQKGTAVGRFLAYRGLRVPGLGFWGASLGVGVLILVGVVFSLAMTLGPQPYYWPDRGTVSYGSSPPIATRTGWMAVALLPFVLVLGAKANLVSAVTGVPHEKLQVFHHWTGYAMFVLGLVHTFPFIVYRIEIGEIMMEWRTSVFYWTGVATLIPQAYLTFMSLPSIRNRYYEFFKASHLLVALLFILFFFFHCNFRLSSWDYFIAASSLYLLSLLTSLVRTHLITGRHTATLTRLPTGLLQIKIPTVTLTWTPGQHVFLRFSGTGLSLHSLTSHPFTICSTAHNVVADNKANEMVFYVKPKRGITGRLARLAERGSGVSSTVLVEGPYGGIEEGVVRRSEVVVIVSGGSGGGFSLGVLGAVLKQKHEHRVSNGGRHDEKGASTIKVIFATQSEAVARWYRDEIEALMTTYGVDIDVSIHITSTSHPSNQKPITDIETAAHGTQEPKRPETASEQVEPLSSFEALPDNNDPHAFAKGRPNLPRIISATAESNSGKRVAVFVCGPASMLHDMKNAAAGAQERILKGGAGGEVYLHSESFSW